MIIWFDNSCLNANDDNEVAWEDVQALHRTMAAFEYKYHVPESSTLLQDKTINCGGNMMEIQIRTENPR